MVRPSGTKGHREHASGQAGKFDEPIARVSSWPPLRPTRLRRERGSVVVLSPTAPIGPNRRGAADATRDWHGHPPNLCRGGVLGGWKAASGRTRQHDARGTGGELGHSLGKEDEVVIEATGNAMAVVRVLSPYVGRVIVANPLQVKRSPMRTSRPTRSMRAFWRRCGPSTFCPRSGCPTLTPNAGGGSWRGATKWSGTHADQERGARDPACASGPTLPAC